MCKVLVLDNDPDQSAWIAEIVANVFHGQGRFTLLPEELNTNPTFQIRVPQRMDPMDDRRREQWADDVLSFAGVRHDVMIDIAIVDLCLTKPSQLRDPEGIWVCKALRRRFPGCFLILESSKTTTDQPSISGGWFKYVPVPSVRIDEVVGIREDDPVSSRNQMAKAIRKGFPLAYA